MANDKHTTKYHLFTTALEEDSAYIGTYDTPQAAYAAIAAPGEVNARLFVTQDDGSLAKVAELGVSALYQHGLNGGQIKVANWHFNDHVEEVGRKYYRWSAHTPPETPISDLYPGMPSTQVTGAIGGGRWIETEPF